MRLSKYVADAGIASRRKAEKLIADGKITVNGAVVSEQGFTVDIDSDIVEFDGKRIYAERKIYLMLNKPSGYLCTVYDPHGRPIVIDLVKDVPGRLYPVGRLDFDTEGLLLLSNDGVFTNHMIHPRYHIKKTYQAWVKGHITAAAVKKLEEGVQLDDGFTAPGRVCICKKGKQDTMIEIEIHEGRKRQVKRMCSAVGFPVISLRRTAFGFLTLGLLKAGQYRHLNAGEVEKLCRMAREGR